VAFVFIYQEPEASDELFFAKKVRSFFSRSNFLIVFIENFIGVQNTHKISRRIKGKSRKRTGLSRAQDCLLVGNDASMGSVPVLRLFVERRHTPPTIAIAFCQGREMGGGFDCGFFSCFRYIIPDTKYKQSNMVDESAPTPATSRPRHSVSGFPKIRVLWICNGYLSFIICFFFLEESVF